MADWIDLLAEALEDDPLTNSETQRILGVARDVAHRVERKTTPLAAFLLGGAVCRAATSGQDRAGALADAVEILRGLLPEAAAPA